MKVCAVLVHKVEDMPILEEAILVEAGHIPSVWDLFVKLVVAHIQCPRPVLQQTQLQIALIYISHCGLGPAPSYSPGTPPSSGRTQTYSSTGLDSPEHS